MRIANALLPQCNQQWIVGNAVGQFEEGCMLKVCATCKDGITLKESSQEKQPSDDEVEVSRWQKRTVEDRLKKVKLIMPLDDAVYSILDALPTFLHHV